MWSLVILFPVGVLAFSDFRYRTISVTWLAVFGVMSLGSVIWTDGWMTMLTRVGGNLSLLVLLGICVGLWLRVWGRKQGLMVRDYIGAGDLVFAVLLTPLFGLREYLIFLLAGAVGSILWWGVSVWIKCRWTTIPLVGTLGISYMFYTLYHIL